MKKLIKNLISSVCIICLLISATNLPTMAAGDINVLLDGTAIEFDVPPQIIDDYTMVPMRAIFEALGYNVKWDPEKQNITATMGSLIIIMTIDNKYMFVGDMAEYSTAVNQDNYTLQHMIQTDKAPQIVDGRTLVPIRVISEASGYNVSWDSSSKSVSIESNKSKLVTQKIENYAGTLVPQYESITGAYCLGTDITKSGRKYYRYKYDNNDINQY